MKLIALKVVPCSMKGSNRPCALHPFDQYAAPFLATTSDGGNAPAMLS